MAIILGIDPGSRITGYGLIEWSGNKVSFLDCGMIKPEAEPLQERLHFIYHQIQHVIHQYQPSEMAIEQVFLSHNADSALKLGQARGVAIVSGMNQALPVSEYSARQVKLSVVGKGAASKEQVQFMICRILGLPEAPQEDAADALGIALCHAFTQQGATQLGLGAETAVGTKHRRYRVKKGRVNQIN